MSVDAILVHLEPFTEILNQDDVKEIVVNKPGELFIERYSGWEHHIDASLTFDELRTLATLVASYSEQEITEKTPILSASLPGGERIQIVMPPACEPGHIAFSIRKHKVLQLALEDYEETGRFVINKAENKQAQLLSDVKTCLESGDIVGFFRCAVLARLNIVISGGTGSGKTTFSNTLIKEIPIEERLITIEDAKEIRLPHENVVRLFASRGGQGISDVDVKQLLQSCLRLNPSRILLSELRGEEAFYFLRAVSSGHPGSITTLHADNPDTARRQIAMMCMQGDSGLQQDQVMDYLDQIVDVIVQFNNKQQITAIQYDGVTY
jgi:type IV secretion system protein VirB11